MQCILVGVLAGKSKRRVIRDGTDPALVQMDVTLVLFRAGSDLIAATPRSCEGHLFYKSSRFIKNRFFFFLLKTIDLLPEIHRFPCD